MLNPRTVTLWGMTGHAEVVVLIGAGGKTTTLQALAKEIHDRGKRVIGTTTTKVYSMSPSVWMPWENPDLPPPLEIQSPCFWYKESEEYKWFGPSRETVDQALMERLPGNPIWVIEGDGAREKKLKCWAHYEPQIPLKSQWAILVISGDLWGKILTEKEIHRPEVGPELLGKTWLPETAARYILYSPIFYPEYHELSWIVLFNRFEANGTNNQDIESTIKAILNGIKDQSSSTNSVSEPNHLRIAIGNVKEGALTCYDLW